MMILVLGLRQKLLEMVSSDISITLSFGATRLIGELCYNFDSEALQFIKYNYIEVARDKLSELVFNPTTESDYQLNERTRAELCWSISNLKQSEINVAEIA
jgi:hypothetical protein